MLSVIKRPLLTHILIVSNVSAQKNMVQMGLWMGKNLRLEEATNF